MSRVAAEREKLVQEKCQSILTNLLADSDNKYCVDCDAKGPRWVSWNIGVFLCIRCAGIHRNLGVHISKVKSVNLDSWKPEQVMMLQVVGNSRARAAYEANLPDNFRRPQTDVALEAFVRAKYEHNKYTAKEWRAPAVPKVNWDAEIEAMWRRKHSRRSAPAGSSSVTAAVAPVLSRAPPASSTVVSTTSTPATSNSKPCTSSATVDLLGLNLSDSAGVAAVSPSAPCRPVVTSSHLNNNNNNNSNNTDSSSADLFGEFLAASIVPAQNTSSTTPTGTHNANGHQLTPSLIGEATGGPAPGPTAGHMSRDSIMALYGQQRSPATLSTPAGAGLGGVAACSMLPSFYQQPPPPPQQHSMFPQMQHQRAGLSMSSMAGGVSPQQQQQPPPPPQQFSIPSASTTPLNLMSPTR